MEGFSSQCLSLVVLIWDAISAKAKKMPQFLNKCEQMFHLLHDSGQDVLWSLYIQTYEN